MIITIDGPAGSGKSTIARETAKALGIAFLDTGATYRAVTLKALHQGVNMKDGAALASLARDADIRLAPAADGLKVFLDGVDVTKDIRNAEVTENAHYVADSPQVREVLVALQRRLGQPLGSFVTEGRDQGSVVFPNADYKIYLDAAPQVRARRRYNELIAAGQQADFDQVLASIIQRDHRDRSRSVAPLVKPAGAVMIDSSEMTVEQAASAVLKVVGGGR